MMKNITSFGAEEISEEQLTSPAPTVDEKAKKKKKRKKYKEKAEAIRKKGADQVVDEESTAASASAPSAVVDCEKKKYRAKRANNKYRAVARGQTPMGNFLEQDGLWTATPQSTTGEEDDGLWTTRATASSGLAPIRPEAEDDGLWTTRATGSSGLASMRPGAERVEGRFPLSESAARRTIIIGGGVEDGPTAPTFGSTAAATVVRAELVQDKTVEAIPMSEDAEHGYQELQKDYRVLRKRVLIGVMVCLLVIGAVVGGVVMGTTRGNNPVDGPTAPTPSGPPGGICLLDMEITCSVDNQAFSLCSEIPTSCTSRPSTLVFQYNGGNCSKSFHNQRDSSFTCLDFVDMGIDSTSQPYLIAKDVATNRIYHQGNITLDGIFSTSDFSNLLGAVMNITVYVSPEAIPRNIAQTFVYQSDCSQSLSLSNRFGGLTLTQIITEEQGVVKSDNGFVNINYIWSVSNVGTENVTLQSIVGTTDLDKFDVALPNEILAPGSSQYFQQTLPIDVTLRQLYKLNLTATAAIVQEGNAKSCIAVGLHEFEAGLGAPSLSPTSMPVMPVFQPATAPTSPPIILDPSSAPVSKLGGDQRPGTTNPPVASPCMVNLEVGCMLSDGSATCTQIPPIPRTQCGERPIALSFRYVGGNCTQSLNNQPSQFRCIDVSGSVAEENVFLVAFDVASGMVYESRRIAAGDEFSIETFGSDTGTLLNITTYTSSGSQTMIQTILFDTSCSGTAPLALGDRFGSAQLTVYVNNLQGVVTSVVETIFTISVSSDVPGRIGSLTSDLDGSVVTDLSGFIDSSRIYGPGEVAQVEQFVRVDSSFDRLYSNFVRATVQPLSQGSTCSGISFFTFEIGGYES